VVRTPFGVKLPKLDKFFFMMVSNARYVPFEEIIFAAWRAEGTS
jgi:hypothetical protein